MAEALGPPLIGLEALLDLLAAGALISATLQKIPLIRPSTHLLVAALLTSVTGVVTFKYPQPSSFAVARLALAIFLQDLLLRLLQDVPWAEVCHWLPLGALASHYVLALLGAPSAGPELFLDAGDRAVWPFTAVLCVLTVVGLVWWSAYVRGRHGPIQGLEALLSPRTTLLPLALANAFAEEVEYRVVLLAALLRGPPAACLAPRALAATLVSNALFAAAHVRGGFPRGRVGGALVLAWGSALALLRCVSGAMLQPYAVHVVADAAIFLLIHAHRRPPRRRAR